MSILKSTVEHFRLTREEQVCYTVLQIFHDTANAHDESLNEILAQLSNRDWRRLLHWLDVSGLALYFLDRITELRQCDKIPKYVLRRLCQNLADNTKRMKGIKTETFAIHEEFKQAGLRYALLKGISLCSSTVPRLEFRSQLDVDFLFAEADVHTARKILESRGYYLHAVNGRSWEFRTYSVPSTSLKHLYCDTQHRSVELHVESREFGRRSLLENCKMQMLDDLFIPVLQDADLFIGQGLHLYKHVTSSFYRAAHVLEFRRHVLMRRNSDVFWNEVYERAAEIPASWWGLGVATLLATQLMGECAPESFLRWTVYRLSAPARLWVEMYGCRTALGSVRDNKLYLLLQQELKKEGIPTRRSVQRALIPLSMPPLIVRGAAHETMNARAKRYRIQLHFLWMRLRFHVVEGIRYVWELQKWRRYVQALNNDTQQTPICEVNKEMTIR